jgi:hypothetical protein
VTSPSGSNVSRALDGLHPIAALEKFTAQFV